MQELIKIISQTNDLSQIALAVSSFFKSSCLITNSNYQIISYATTKGFNDEVFFSSIRRREMTYEFISKLAEEKKDYSYLEVLNSPYKRRISCLTCEGLVVGYLILVDESKNLLKEFSMEVFQIVEGLLAKQLVFSQQNGNIFTNKIDQFLLSLLTDDWQDERLLDLKIAYLFRKNDYPNHLALVDLSSYQTIDCTNDSLRQELKKALPNSHAMLYQKNIIIFYLAKEKEILAQLATKYKLKIICSAEITSPKNMKSIYEASFAAFQFAKKLHTDFFIDEVSRYQLLITFAKISSSLLMLDEKIQKIEEYDQKNNTEYLSLLYLYLKNQKSLQKTCQDLFIHRNTVLYRLGKLKEFFNLDLDDYNKECYYLIMAGILLYRLGKYQLFLI